MKAKYSDIRNLTDAEPLWFDEHGVPRYAVFEPGLSPNIYANEVALLEISCQLCKQSIFVELNSCRTQTMLRDQNSLSDAIKEKACYYGDPPIHGDERGLCGGATMTSDTVRVAQFWKKDRFDWVRDSEMEIEIDGEPE